MVFKPAARPNFHEPPICPRHSHESPATDNRRERVHHQGDNGPSNAKQRSKHHLLLSRCQYVFRRRRGPIVQTVQHQPNRVRRRLQSCFFNSPSKEGETEFRADPPRQTAVFVSFPDQWDQGFVKSVSPTIELPISNSPPAPRSGNSLHPTTFEKRRSLFP